MRFLDVFLLHCLLSDSPPDTPEEIAAISRNQHKTAAYGREPDLLLQRGNQRVKLTDWGDELLASFAPIAAVLDETHQTTDYVDALRGAQSLLRQPDLLPSARVLAVMAQDFDNSFTAFGCAQSLQTKAKVLSLPLSSGQQAKFEAMSQQSVRDQKAIEAAEARCRSRPSASNIFPPNAWSFPRPPSRRRSPPSDRGLVLPLRPRRAQREIANPGTIRASIAQASNAPTTTLPPPRRARFPLRTRLDRASQSPGSGPSKPAPFPDAVPALRARPCQRVRFVTARR